MVSGRCARNVMALALLSLGALATGCDDDDDKTGADAGLPEVAAEVTTHYAHIVHATYRDTAAQAADLQAKVEAFLAAPSEAGLEAARDAWRAAREPYLQSEVFRFYDGPIDNPIDGPEGQINAWPLDENYIDYVAGDDAAGIVNDPEATIDAEALMALNEAGGEANIATGYHAIEFLLWGQDHDPDGPGDRPYTDFVTDGSGTANNQARRAEYLRVTTALLAEQLAHVAEAWTPGAANYGAEFTAAAPEVGLERILTGMIVLSGFETGGERLQTSYDSGEQEDEHSCFSDNTHRDMVQDVRGIQNVWLGSYTKLDGTALSGVGVKDVVAAVDADLASTLDARIAESLALAEALQPPFDREIAFDNTAGRARVLALIQSLRTQESLLQDAFRAFGLSVPEVE